ncbi:MAG: TRAP transporter large permease, partial [Lachnospiraceae bacterium]|nr:TRAP transporter large permease [Lachnospiraceae bacterium]
MWTKLIIALLILFILLALNLPIYMALLAAGLFMQVFINGMPLRATVTTMFESVSQSSLLAIPFFILAGSFLAGGSLGTRLVDVFQAFLKRIRSGVAIACLLANAFFGAISGSPPAATATFSKLLYKPLEEQYGETNAVGVIVGASGLSSIIPPSVVMIIYCVVAEASIAEMFIAGILPGILLVLIFGAYLLVRCPGHPHKEDHVRGERRRALFRSLPVLVLPILVLGGIYGGVFTPSEAGALSAVYSAFVSVFVLHDMTLKDFWRVLREGVTTSVQVFILIAASGVFAQALTVSQAPQALAGLFSGLSPIAFMLILMVVLLIFGCFFDGSSAILILVPMLNPVVKALGIDPIHIGIVYCTSLTVGMITPPFGLSLFVAQGVLKKDFT